ncbi:unnamed protein product [Rhodiola kirilowii]
MSMVGEMTYFLGLQVKQKSNGIFISQTKYARNLIKKFDLDKATLKRTPAATHVKITKDEAGTSVDKTLYRSMIGSFLYLTASRPDIALLKIRATCRCVANSILYNPLVHIESIQGRLDGQIKIRSRESVGTASTVDISVTLMSEEDAALISEADAVATVSTRFDNVSKSETWKLSPKTDLETLFFDINKIFGLGFPSSHNPDVRASGRLWRKPSTREAIFLLFIMHCAFILIMCS